MINTLGITPPPAFPSSTFDRVNELSTLTGPAARAHRALFGAAWNGVAFRYLAAADADREWRASLTESRTVKTPEIRARQETALFQFFSALQSDAFATYVLGAIGWPKAFPDVSPARQLRLSLESTVAAFDTVRLGHPLARALAGLVSASEWEGISSLRNVLIHRSAPTRTIRVQAGGAPPEADEWSDTLYVQIFGVADPLVSPELTSAALDWLDARLPRPCSEAEIVASYIASAVAASTDSPG